MRAGGGERIRLGEWPNSFRGGGERRRVFAGGGEWSLRGGGGERRRFGDCPGDLR